MSGSGPLREVLNHVVDVHCHPTDSEIPEGVINELPITICAMATRKDDQALVAQLARAHPDKSHLKCVDLASLGFHPWFAHWISLSSIPPPSKKDHYRSLFLQLPEGPEDEAIASSTKEEQALEEMLDSLPEPVPLEECLSSLRQSFKDFPRAILGEVGLDRSARVPFNYRSERRKLSPFTVPFEHQLALLEAQLSVAVEMQRNVSLHSVKLQKATLDLFERMKNKFGQRWLNINIDLHSCGVSPETWRDIGKRHPNVYLSLSTVINGRSPNHRKLIESASPDRILAESDIHEIGQCADRTWDMIMTIAEVRGWKVEERWDDELDESQWGVVRRLERNFRQFMRGGHNPSEEKLK